jgi:hypothetical protein
MRFWTLLRLVGSALFLSVLLLAWLGTDSQPAADGPALHAAPAFSH